MFRFILFLLIWVVLSVLAFRKRMSAILAIGGSLIVAILPFVLFSKLFDRNAGSPNHASSGYSEKLYIDGDQWFGTTSKELFSKLHQYAAQDDPEAYRKLYATGLFTGEITRFKDGEEVMLVDTAVISGLMKIRRKGDLQEYWTRIDATKHE